MALPFQVKTPPADNRTPPQWAGRIKSWRDGTTRAAAIAAQIVVVTGLLCFAIIPGSLPAAESSPTPQPKPAKLRISGCGWLGNRVLKRMLRTVELGGAKPEYFGPTFVEDSALILAARIKRDGY